MPIEAVGAFEQLAAKPAPTLWLRQEAVSTPELGKLNLRMVSVLDTAPIPRPRLIGVFSESPESFALLGRQVFTDREPLRRSNLARVVDLSRQHRLTRAANDEERIRENLTYCVVRDLIEREKIGRARELLAALPLEYLNDPLVFRLLKTLARPTVRRSEKHDTDRQKDFNWLRDHAQEYRGQWVALHEGQLITTAATLKELSQKVKTFRLSHPPLLHRIK